MSFPHISRTPTRALATGLLGLLLCGCATMTFKPLRESRFINMDAEVLHVAYGEEKRTETLHGIVCTFDRKVLLRLPSGKRAVLYQTMSASGVKYVSDGKRYEFIEKGPYCILFENGATLFEGVYSRN